MTKSEERINVYDDNEMRNAGFFRPFDQAKRDPSVWTKTKKEKKELKKAKAIFKNANPFWNGHVASTNSEPYRPLRSLVVVNIYPNKALPKTIYSKICFTNKISDYLSTFYNPNTGKSSVRKYYFNGKTYYPGEYPKY